MAQKIKTGNPIFGFFSRSFVAGLTVIVPLYLTIYIIEVIINSFDKLIHILPDAIRPEHLLFPGAGILLTIVFATLAGILVRNFIGKNFIKILNTAIEKIPVVAGLYGLLRQVSEAILGEGGQSFNRVILVEWPRRDSWMVAFVTNKTAGEVGEKLKKRVPGEEFLNVFVPTTPNPTSGFYFMVPEKDVIDIDMTVDQAFKIIVSAGSLPEEVASKTPRLI